jgi:type I restriction enzyme S subunit
MRSGGLAMALIKYKLGSLLELSENKNDNLEYGIGAVKGISIQKIFIETKADMTGVSLRPYYLVQPDDFAYVTVTSRNGEKITIAHNTTETTYIVSSSYVVFRIKRKDILLSDYLFMYFNRPEFDRYSRFNSWGSARETFDWSEMCDIDIELPPIEIQQKYVDIYNAMLANQRDYENGLEDLKLACFAMADHFKHIKRKMPVGELLEEVDVRNSEGVCDSAQGINITKQFMSSVASSSDLLNYKLVYNNQFAYSAMQTGRDECIRIALYNGDKPIAVSPAYSVLKKKTDIVLEEYIQMWFSRPESDRLGWFMSDASVRANLDLPRFYEIEVPVPDLDEQMSLVNIYNAYALRREINEQLKAQIRGLCPILIRGSLDEAIA